MLTVPILLRQAKTFWRSPTLTLTPKITRLVLPYTTAHISLALLRNIYSGSTLHLFAL